VRQFGAWDERRQDRFFEDGWRDAPYEILLGDGEPCGYVSVEPFPDYTHVRDLVVPPDFQRRALDRHSSARSFTGFAGGPSTAIERSPAIRATAPTAAISRLVMSGLLPDPLR
jgi:hypothetical protein